MQSVKRYFLCISLVSIAITGYQYMMNASHAPAWMEQLYASYIPRSKLQSKNNLYNFFMNHKLLLGSALVTIPLTMYWYTYLYKPAFQKVKFRHETVKFFQEKNDMLREMKENCQQRLDALTKWNLQKNRLEQDNEQLYYEKQWLIKQLKISGSADQNSQKIRDGLDNVNEVLTAKSKKITRLANMMIEVKQLVQESQKHWKVIWQSWISSQREKVSSLSSPNKKEIEQELNNLELWLKTYFESISQTLKDYDYPITILHSPTLDLN